MDDLLRAGLMNALTASALAVAVAGLSLVFSRRPALVHCLWLIALAKLATPPLLEAPLGSAVEEVASAIWRPAPAGPAAVMIALEPIPAERELATLPPLESFSAVRNEPNTYVEIPTAWSTPWRALGLVWLAGAVGAAAVALVRVVRFQRLLKNAEPAGDSVEAEIAGLAARMGLKRAPRAVLVEGRIAPLLWAVGPDPRLVLPRLLWKSLGDRQRALLLAHELAHWRRGDHRVRLLELAVTVAYWWLPVVWLVRRALRDVEEQCCDAWVVWLFPDEARTYAETLLDAVDFLNPVADPEPLLASGFGKATHLRRRLVMVMKGTTPRSMGWTGTLGALALAGVLLPTSPIWAQKDDAIEFKAEPVETVVIGVAQEPIGSTIVVDAKALKARAKAIQKAVDELTAQAKAFAEKKDATEAEKNQARTLRKLAVQLAELSPKDDLISIEAKSLVLHGTPQGNPKEILAAQSRVERLRSDLNAQQRQLAETLREYGDAVRELAQLQGRQAVTVKQFIPEVEFLRQPLQSNQLDATSSPPLRETDRLDQLEGKLSKVLEELESLKEQKAEAGDKK